jgi:uncharacterized protein YkwD
MSQFFISPTGSDQNAGTSEAQAWRSLAALHRVPAGSNTATLMPGTWWERLPLVSGLTVRAKESGKSVIDGSHTARLTWSRDAAGIWHTADPGGVMGIWLGTFEQNGAFCCAYDGAYAKFDPTRPGGQVIAGSKSQWQAASGLHLTTAGGGNPNDEGVVLTRGAQAITLDGLSDVLLQGIATRFWKTAVGSGGGKNIRLEGCQFRYTSQTALWFTNIDGAELAGCVVQGGGSLLAHAEDAIHCEQGRLKVSGCDISFGGHGLMFCQRGGSFQVLGSYLHDSGGSGITLVRGTSGAVIEGCWFERCATQRSPSVRDVGSALQIHGNKHRVTNCHFEKNSKHFLFSATGPGTDNPTTSDTLVTNCTLLDAEETAVEMQEAVPSGEIARNVFRGCIISGAGLDLLSCWFAGSSAGPAGSSNHFENSQIARGRIRGTAGTFDVVEAARARWPAVYAGSQSDPVTGAGSALTKPPTTGGPPPGAPVLARLVPSSGLPGQSVRAEGSGFGIDAPVVVAVTVKPDTPEGKRRLTPPGGTDTLVNYVVPPDAVTGEVRVRRSTELSNPLTFTVEGEPPPPPPPPPASLRVTLTAAPAPTGATFQGTVVGGAPLPAGSTVSVSVVRKSDGKVAAGLVTIAGEPPPPPPPPTDQEAELVRRVNAERAAQGLAALATNAKLAAAAKAHCAWMAATATLSHTGEGGSQMGDRMAAQGYRFVSAAENIASGFSTAEAVMLAWMGSAGHRANILGPFTEIGVARAVGADGRVYWCQEFCSPAAGALLVRGES